jgi:predicted alpha/beta-hydrolase family hydrolase
MTPARPRPVTITIEDARRVSGLLQAPRKNARGCYMLAHGAGAGMSHKFMTAVADGPAERGIATLHYQFPYMEQGSKRPDAPKLAQATVRAAVAQASHLLPKLSLVAGGKSLGGRMTSQAQAEPPSASSIRDWLQVTPSRSLPGVRGLAFLGFPIHAAGRLSEETIISGSKSRRAMSPAIALNSTISSGYSGRPRQMCAGGK